MTKIPSLKKSIKFLKIQITLLSAGVKIVRYLFETFSFIVLILFA